MKFRVGDYVRWYNTYGVLLGRGRVFSRNGDGWVHLRELCVLVDDSHASLPWMQYCRNRKEVVVREDLLRPDLRNLVEDDDV